MNQLMSLGIKGMLYTVIGAVFGGFLGAVYAYNEAERAGKK